jgi:hypothetical protein
MYSIPHTDIPTHIRWSGRSDTTDSFVFGEGVWQPLGMIYPTSASRNYEWALSETQQRGIANSGRTDIVVAFFSFRDGTRVGIFNDSLTPFTLINETNSGNDAINIRRTLNIDMEAALTAIGGDGLAGINGENALYSLPYNSSSGNRGRGGSGAKGTTGRSNFVVAGAMGETGTNGLSSYTILEREAQPAPTQNVSELIITNSTQNLTYDINGVFDSSILSVEVRSGNTVTPVTHGDFPEITRSFNAFVGSCDDCGKDPCECSLCTFGCGELADNCTCLRADCCGELIENCLCCKCGCCEECGACENENCLNCNYTVDSDVWTCPSAVANEV